MVAGGDRDAFVLESACTRQRPDCGHRTLAHTLSRNVEGFARHRPRHSLRARELPSTVRPTQRRNVPIEDAAATIRNSDELRTPVIPSRITLGAAMTVANPLRM